MDTTYSDGLEFSEFEEITRYTYNQYHTAIDTATIVSEKTGASIEVPITAHELHCGIYHFNNLDIKRMRINGIDNVDTKNLRKEPTHHFGVNISKLERESNYLTDDMQFRGGKCGQVNEQ